MTGVLILHAREEAEWALALAAELDDLSPVRFSVGVTPARISFGPSVVRVALWSEESKGEAALASVLDASPQHSILVSKRGVAAEGPLRDARPARRLEVDCPRAAVGAIREAISCVADNVHCAREEEHQRTQQEFKQRRRTADRITAGVFASSIVGVAGALFTGEYSVDTFGSSAIASARPETLAVRTVVAGQQAQEVVAPPAGVAPLAPADRIEIALALPPGAHFHNFSPRLISFAPIDESAPLAIPEMLPLESIEFADPLAPRALAQRLANLVLPDPMRGDAD